MARSSHLDGWGWDSATLVKHCRELLAENARLKRDMQQMVSGLRSHLADLSSRIGPARRPEDIKAKLEEIYNAYNAWGDKSAEAERDKLLAFKSYTHARLDAAGVSADPDSPHKSEGCRIGGRLDEVFTERDRFREALTWAVGFIQCNLPRTSAEYPDMRNAQSLAAAHPVWTGEFQRAMWRAEIAEEESAKLRSIQAGGPDDIRACGWAVAAHNDYRLDGKPHTFWLFTQAGRAVKGEGRTDKEALNQVREQIGLPKSSESTDDTTSARDSGGTAGAGI